MRIVAAEVIVTSPGRNFVTLRITTEDGARRARRRHRSTAGSWRSPATCATTWHRC